MAETEQLHEFWAVTLGGVYHVTAERNEQRFPTVVKIKNFRKNKNAPVGMALNNGSTVGITSIGIILYSQGSRSRLPEDVTSTPVGLFLCRRKAMSLQRGKKPLRFYDPRWEKDTFAVLDAIGNNHPSFVVSTHRSLSLRYAYKQNPQGE